MEEEPLFRSTSAAPPPIGTRYSRVSQPGAWLRAREDGFVGAILNAVRDRRDRIVLAWPSRPDGGFVAGALAIREARAAGNLAKASLALWPWRSGTTYAGRSILVHPEDVLQVARKGHTALTAKQRGHLADDSLCLVELRLNDLLRDGRRNRRETMELAPVGGAVSTPVEGRTASTINNPTLLELTPTFVPMDSARTPYAPEPDQILKRVRRHTSIGTIATHLAAVGDPRATPYAIMGLRPAGEDELRRCLDYARFAEAGLDGVIVDLTRTARASLSQDWEKDFLSLVVALDSAPSRQSTPIIVLSEDAFTYHRAAATLRKHRERTKTARQPALRQGALTITAGLIEPPDAPPTPSHLPALVFEADVKDATLVPVRDRLLQLIRTLRDGGHSDAAMAVGAGLRALSFFASMPVGLDETKMTASILFEGDTKDDIEARSQFFPTAALQPLADAERVAPTFALEIRAALEEVKSRLEGWKTSTPVSLKLAQVLREPAWNDPDVLLVLQDSRMVEVFLVSNNGIGCRCTVVDPAQLADRTKAARWRRIIVVRPHWKTMRSLLTIDFPPDRTLLLCDGAGASLVASEVGPLADLKEFGPYAERAQALRTALVAGGLEDSLDLTEAHLRLPSSASEEVADFTQSEEGYSGEVIRLRLAGGGQLVYRPTGEVLAFTPDEVRPFRKVPASKIQRGDSILVLDGEIRDKLARALARSRRAVAQLKLYHAKIAAFREGLSASTLSGKARQVLAAMRATEPSMGDHELPNIKRWLSVEPADHPQQPRAARDHRRFAIFMQAVGINAAAAQAFWNFAIVPTRTYSVQEGHSFNRRVVQFVLDPEGMACGARCREYDGLWQAITESVDEVVEVEISNA